MKTRHKIPAVFSIYMVDVLCCALGCVILLWQLYHHESEEQTAANSEIRKQLDDAKQAAETSTQQKVEVTLELADKTAALDKAVADKNQAIKLALVQRQRFDDMKKLFDSASAMVKVLRFELKTKDRQNALTAAELADKIRAHAELFDKLAQAEKKLRALTKDIAIRDTENHEAAKRAIEKGNLLKLLEQELTLLRGQNKEAMAKTAAAASRSRALEQDLERGKRDLLAINRRFADLNADRESMHKRITINVKDLESAKLALAALERDKMSLLRKASAAENRFAGITLTGRRVLFLVDMSGSMEMVDENTLDPDKWPIVCATVAKIMRSLPDLREYQVIIFSDRFKYAFGGDGRWLSYDGDASAKKVAAGLKAIKPKGGTDMYAAFQEAFRFRASGLDTIYFFSDGLPNMGEGAPAGAANLTESQRGEILGKHIRNQLKNRWNDTRPGTARVRINCVGFFFESPDLGAFLWALAREHDGSFVGMSRP